MDILMCFDGIFQIFDIEPISLQGIMTSFMMAIFFMVLGQVFARLADYYDQRRI